MRQTKDVTRETSNPSPRTGAVCVFFTGTLLGFIPIFKTLLNEQSLSSETVVLVRLTIALIMSFLFILADMAVQTLKGNKLGVWPDREHIWQFIGYGAISIAAVNFLYIKSLDYVSAPVAAFSVFAAEPVVTFIAAVLLKRCAATVCEVLLIVIIVMGCVFVNFEGIYSNKQLTGVLLALATGACYGLFSIFGQKLIDKYNSHCMLFWQYAIATTTTITLFSCMPSYYFAFSELADLVQTPRPKMMFSALGMGILATFLPYWLYACGLRKGVKNTTASALTLMEPVTTTILVWAFFAQALLLVQGIGIMLVLSASIVLSFVKQAE